MPVFFVHQWVCEYNAYLRIYRHSVEVLDAARAKWIKHICNREYDSVDVYHYNDYVGDVNNYKNNTVSYTNINASRI